MERLASGGCGAVLCLLQLREGSLQLEQRDRRVLASRGDCVLIRGDEPCRLEFRTRTCCLWVELPYVWLSAWVADPRRLALRRVSRRSWGVALARALQCLSPHELRELALPTQAVAEQVAALLALSAGQPRTQPPPPDLIGRVRRTLLDRYHEIDLDAARVATENGIGRRSLHAAFARAQSTFADELAVIRLDRARRMLGDRRFGAVQIRAVAAQCGFGDASHFARRFRHRFGVTPAAYRRSAAPCGRVAGGGGDQAPLRT